MSKGKTYGVKWRSGQTEADVIDARPRFSVARAAAEAKRHWVGGLDPQLEADLRTCMATGIGFEEVSIDYAPPGFEQASVLRPDGVRSLGELIAAAHDDDGRPIER